MNRGIIFLLILVVIIGIAALYAIQRGPELLIKSPSEELIAFVSDRGGNTDIWTMHADGTNMLHVTDDAANDRLPAWSPNSKEIVSVSDRQDGTYQLILSAWDGSYSKVTTASAGVKDKPAWSSDGKQIIYLSSGKIYIKDRNGHEEQYFPPEGTPQAGGQGLYFTPNVYTSLSSDLKSLLFMQESDHGQELYILNRQDYEESIHHEHESEENGHEPGQPALVPSVSPLGITIAKDLDVAWSLDGDYLAVAFIGRDGENGLLVADLGSIDATDLITFKGDTKGAAKPVWSPDGKQIAFEMWSVKNESPSKCLGIYKISASGDTPQNLVAGDAREPNWSPDGKQLVYTLSRSDGNRDIWRVNADGTDAQNLTKGKGDNFSPVWSPLVRRKQK